MAFSIDLPGRIRNINLSKTNCLQPLFEAIVNSIHAIGEVKPRPPANPPGTIIVRIVRSLEQTIFKEGGLPINDRPLAGFSVEDNGAGFTEENYSSFLKSDTTRKQRKGGKGVGRFLWLKAFDTVHIESVYREKGQWRRREFDFLNTELGVENESVTGTSEMKRRTAVHLRGMKPFYLDECPKTSRGIARKIIDHCMLYFVMETCPRIIVEDPDEDQRIVLDEVFESDIKLEEKAGTIGMNGRNLRITHLLTRSSEDASHRLYYCAHQRAVSSVDMKSRIPNLSKGLNSPAHGGAVYYTGLVSGDYLDERVSQDRTRFELTDDIFSDSRDVLQWKEIAATCTTAVKQYLSPYLAPVQRRKEQQIHQLIRERSPQYRTLVRHRPDLLEDIPPDLDDDALELKLHERYMIYESDLKRKAHTFIAGEMQTYEEMRKHFASFMEQWNEQGVSKLAQYVVHRKATLELFSQRLKAREDKTYPLEETIHSLIMPMKTTSDDIPYDSMNLWLIDERLAYHSYLASDKRLDQLENCAIDDDDRTDLIIFNSPFAFADTEGEYNSIVIIEFKRPMRNDYRETPDEVGNEDAKRNPITQILRYVDKIREGKAMNREGRPIDVCAGARFYAYLICDLTSSLRQIAKENDLKKTPDEKGYYKYWDSYRLYMEVISFDQLLDNARKRNKMFFDKLNLPDRR